MKVSEKLLKSLSKTKYLDFIARLEKEKAQQYASVILTFSALSIFGIFAINPTLSTIAQLHRQLEDTKAVDLKLQEKLNNLSSLQQQYQTLQPDLAYIQTALPETASVTLFTAKIQSLAATSDVAINGLSTGDTLLTSTSSAKNVPESITFSVDIAGNREKVNEFLLGLSRLDRISTLEVFSVSTNSEKEKETVLSIRGKTYFKP